MNLYTLYAAIRDAVAQDAELAAWAADQFGKAISVYAGLPSADFPNMDDDTPFIVLGDPSDARGRTNRTITYEISGWVGLTNSGMELGMLANVTEPSGVKQIVDALRMVRDAVVAGLPGNVQLDRFDTAADTLGAHDEIHGYFEMTFIEDLAIGQDPMD